ncbi:membrane bound FAD containing D-sorbitol dehydrogenase [Neokomagataea thailandica NBRC 106555]|nr:membrane bound FAD containing D-sorbitol dehydrogenase [Neokomagataea thailandica NBRC 106555]
MQVLSTVMAASIAGRTSTVAAAEPLKEKFYAISKVVLGKENLDPVTSNRMLGALLVVFPKYENVVHLLEGYTSPGGSPDDVLKRSEDNQHQEYVHDLVAAWYTGTASGHMNAPMVSYFDALMYRATKDALPVPTYCFAEPGWWTQDPPELGIALFAPKPITPPAPPPVAVETKPAPAAPLHPHLPDHTKSKGH